MPIDPQLLTYGVLAVLAAVVAWRFPAHRPVAAFIAWMVFTEIARIPLTHAYATSARPYHGGARFAFHLDEAVALSWWFFYVATCLRVFVGRGSIFAFAAWLAVVAACVLFYPRMSGPALVTLYRSTAFGTAFVAWACIVYGLFAARRPSQPALPHLVLILYAATDVATYLADFVQGFVENWPLVRLANYMLLAACIVAHLAWLSRNRRAAHNA